ncbi:MAG: peptide deformylase [Acidimicrobiia bacterium]|nr:peptide deformylase [Acidimicrobiia bacterium]
MTVRPIVVLPAPVLAVPAAAVGGAPGEPVVPEVAEVCRDLVDTMRCSPHSVGVAAPQIGVGLRIFCVDVTGHRKARSCHGEVVLVDPEVVAVEGRDVGREGCMSVPDLTGDVARATRVIVRGRTPDGAVVVLDCDAFEARAVQHELDHLDGALFLDRLVSRDRIFPRKVYR